MDSPERIISYSKREVEDSLDGERDVAVDNAEWEGSGKRKHKFSKSKRSSAAEDVDGWDSSGRRKSSGERNESRRQSGGSSRGDFDEGDNDVKKDSSSKQAKKRQESSALEKLSNWYQDGDLENRHDGGDKSGHRSHSRGDDNEKNPLRKATKFSEREGSHRRSKSKDERARDGEDEKALERDTYHSERRETSREKSHSLSEAVKSKRRWDESDASTKTVDSSILAKSEAKSVSVSDSKHESTCEKTTSSKLDSGEGKDRVLEPTSDKAKSYSREERRIDSDKSLIRSRSDAVEEDNKASPVTCEDRVGRDKSERHREVKSSGREAVDSRDSRDRSSNLEEDANPWVREKGSTEILPHRSKSPDRSGRLRPDLENSEMEYDRGSSLKRKDVEKDSSRDDRVKGRENSWSDRNREREGSRESWKRRQTANDRDVDSIHDRDRDRDLPRRGRDRMDTDRALGRVGNRKDGRSEAVKASSNFGISTENYDVIEIQPKPLDYGRDDPNFARKTEAVPLHDPKVTTHDEWTRPKDDVPKTEGHITSGDNSSAKNVDESTSMQDHNSWMDDVDGKAGRPRGQQGSLSARPGGQSSSGGSQPLNTGQESSNFGRLVQQGPKGSRLGRGGRVRPPGRDNQQVSIPVPMLGSPFGHLGVPPPGPMQSMNPGLSPGPGPPVPPGVFVSPFSSPVVWPGSRAYDMSMLPVSPGMSPLPPGPTGQRFPPNMGAPPSPALYFNQPGQLKGMLPNTSGPGFNAIVPMGRGNQNEKISGGWVPPKSGGPAGKAPSRGEQNDYSQNFVDTGKRPQNFIRELELTNVEDYPKLRELIQKKDEIVKKASTPPMYFKADLREFVLSPDSFGTKFDVILVDPPWEEYVHRAPGVTHESWTFEEIMNLKIEAIADTPSFIFLWVGDGVGLEQGRQCLKKWGFRRCEDICWVKTNKESATPGLRHDSNTLFQHSKEHCLMGIKGTVRRSTDGHIIHANIDTDVIIAEEPDYGSTAKPYEMYRIIEHFALGRRRLELFGVDHNIREGWLTVGKDLSYSNFNIETFVRSFADKDGKVWQGGGGRNPPPEAPHLVQTTPDIEALRPKSPMKNQQQLQQQSNSISLTTANSSNRRPAGNAPQNASGFNLNQEGSSLNHMGAPWPPPMEGFKGPNENMFDIYGYNMHPVPPSGEFLDFETQRMMGMM